MKKYQAKNTSSFSNYYHCCSTAEGETISVEYLRSILHGCMVFLMWYYLYYGWPLTFPLCKIVKCNFIVTNKRMMMGKPYWYHNIQPNQQRIRNTNVSIFFAFFPVFPSHPTSPPHHHQTKNHHTCYHIFLLEFQVCTRSTLACQAWVSSAELCWMTLTLFWPVLALVCFFVCLVLW